MESALEKLKAIPSNILIRIFNLVLWCGKLLQHLAKSRTTFIPKKGNATAPEDFRPITIPSVIVRSLHTILAKRLSTLIDLDPRQRGFQQTDGCADNAILLDLVLRDNHQKYNSCYIASLDISKAFDSVSHNTIFGTLKSYGAPAGFIKYLRSVYEASSTVLKGDSWTSSDIKPKRGVKQGDPLSPVLFNLVIDRLLNKLPKEISCNMGNLKINAIVFADDILLLASTAQGLQELLKTANEFLISCGMTLNLAKCLTISIKGQPRQKNTVVEQKKFNINNMDLPCLKRTDEWRYLGIAFSPDGKRKYVPTDDLLPKLEKLTRAPLKPQQRLHALRTVLIPQLYHQLTLGTVMVGSLNKTDKIVRNTVRKWLDLPKDTPTAFFHADIEHGGLGVPSVRWRAPWLRYLRITRCTLPGNEAVTADTFMATELDRISRRLTIGNQRIVSEKDISEHWRQKLHASVDGFGLREASKYRQQHRWVREPSRLLSGRDFINSIKCRINALPSRSRTSRGRSQIDRTCRAGCDAPETLNHIVQQCHRTHASRIDRHNSVVKYLCRGLNNKGFTTIEEPTLNTTEGVRKPDIVAIKNRRAVVVDAQVVTDGRSLDEAHERKRAYYNTNEIKDLLKLKYEVDDVHVFTATLNWRGIWSCSSVQHLIAHDIIKHRETALLSTRVTIGTIRSFRIFNAITTVSHRRGIG